jgi:hypothetical protein
MKTLSRLKCLIISVCSIVFAYVVGFILFCLTPIELILKMVIYGADFCEHTPFLISWIDYYNHKIDLYNNKINKKGLYR